MKRLAVLALMVLACSRTSLGRHAPDGAAPGVGGVGGVGTPAGSGGARATGGVKGTGGIIGSTSGSGGATSTTDLDSCSSDAECLRSCVWITAPTSSGQCSALYCCSMTWLSQKRCDANRAAWATYCPGRSPTSQPCPCIARCLDEDFACSGGRCTTTCISPTDAASDAAFVTSVDGGPGCGDGIVNAPEECDLGQQNNTAVYGDLSGCTRSCTRPHYCGDGYIDADNGEMCDGGDRNGPPPCSKQCILWIP